MPVWLIYVVELCCDIFPWVPDLDHTHLRAWLVYGQIGGVTPINVETNIIQTMTPEEYIKETFSNTQEPWKGRGDDARGKRFQSRCDRCWKYALEAIIKWLLLYFIVHDNFLLFML